MSVSVDKPKNRTADSLFSPDKYVNKPGVVVFAEHSTRLPDGTPVTYDRDALEKIARNCSVLLLIQQEGRFMNCPYDTLCLWHVVAKCGQSETGPDRLIVRCLLY
ncbi:MAG: hypothetical protein H5U08_13070 [Thermogutta sp.]|uniref:hypothetical protein n=1 Tax=Thermogutta sp. TaxID=1962930 RepID=UPI0019843DB8|nr:hypothetical protein [Thermogutta sp.]MBC7353287.1 hypothetical protein [Thermogutta sp.]